MVTMAPVSQRERVADIPALSHRSARTLAGHSDLHRALAPPLERPLAIEVSPTLVRDEVSS